MNGYWENLRPFEKRVVVGAGALFFVVLNFLLVLPHFSDLKMMHIRMEEAQKKLRKYQTEIAQTNAYAHGLRELEHENSDVAPEEQGLQFANAVNLQAIQTGVNIMSGGSPKTQTNQFFVEKSETVYVQSGEKQLVDFLYNLGSGDSQIRVRSLTVHPELPARQQLLANVTLVASYQRKAIPRAAARQPAGSRPQNAPAKSGPAEKSPSASGKSPTSTKKSL